MLEFKQITYDDTKPFLLEKHYAHRMPSISYAYGLYLDDTLHGVLTFGTPASPSLQKGFFGNEYKSAVIELNRLYVDDMVADKVYDATSQFVAYGLRQIKQYNLLVVSFSDTGMHHNGTIYKATNFEYLGSTVDRTDKFGGFGKHSRHYDKFAEYPLRVVRSVKMKYVYFAMDKRHKKKFKKLMKYDAKSYEKIIDEQRYSVGDTKGEIYLDTNTNEWLNEDEARNRLAEYGLSDGGKS